MASVVEELLNWTSEFDPIDSIEDVPRIIYKARNHGEDYLADSLNTWYERMNYHIEAEHAAEADPEC